MEETMSTSSKHIKISHNHGHSDAGERSSLVPSHALWSYFNSSALDVKQWLESVAAIHGHQCHLEVSLGAEPASGRDAKSAEGLRTEGMDATRVAMVSAQIRGSVTIHAGTSAAQLKVCVKISQLLGCLRSARPQDQVEMWMLPERDNVLHVQLCEPSLCGCLLHFEISTLVEEFEPLPGIFESLYHTHSMVLDLGSFLRVVRVAKDNKATRLTLQLQQRRRSVGGADGNKGSHWALACLTNGPTPCDVRFPAIIAGEPTVEPMESLASSVQESAGGVPTLMRLRAEAHETYQCEGMDTIFEGHYMLDYLHQMTRNLNPSMPFHLFFGPSHPLLIEAGNPMGQQFLHFLLAPCVPEE
jgi:hypothetical protein